MIKNKLLQARLKKGLSQEELADRIGMTQSNYCRREKGIVKISEIEWLKIAKALDVLKEDIFEPDASSKNNVSKKAVNNIPFILPDFVLDHIELLKTQNQELKSENQSLKEQIKKQA